jgi:DNA-3-methyladenine glycosylase II
LLGDSRHLTRPNVWPVDDLGLLKAIALPYREGERISAREAREIGEARQP